MCLLGMPLFMSFIKCPDRAVEKRSPAGFQFMVFIRAAPASTAASSVSLARWE